MLLWNNLWSMCRYITGLFNGFSGKHGKQYLTATIWKCVSGIGDHRFTFIMDLLSNYTFYTNRSIFSIGWLLKEDVPSLCSIYAKLRTICNVVWSRFKLLLNIITWCNWKLHQITEQGIFIRLVERLDDTATSTTNHWFVDFQSSFRHLYCRVSCFLSPGEWNRAVRNIHLLNTANM